MPKLEKQGGLQGAMESFFGPKARAQEGRGINAGPIIEAMRSDQPPLATPGTPVTVDLGTGQVKSTAEMMIIAIDPGDIHCGMAEGVTGLDGTFTILRAWEMTPDDCADYVAEWLLSGELEALVVEKFNLYEDKVEQQIGSEFLTPQLIGVLRYLVRVAGMEAEKQGRYRARLAMYGADTKKSMRAQLNARKIALLPAEADHARDAQLHLWHYVGAEKMGWGAAR